MAAFFVCMKKDFCKEFENKVLSQLNNLVGDVKNLRLGVAVSGGADSVSLLMALNSICSSLNLPLFVITVNHNIRPKEETYGDALYVEQLCNNIKENNQNLTFLLKELKPGLVSEISQKRGGGIEEAARFLRYSAFEEFILENNLDYLCLAHNKNDQEETLLMRFLQGSGVDAGSGICAKRGKYIRPLIEIERKEIEEYLICKNIEWKTDSTNLDTQYLRNKIRLELIPFLNEKFSGWQNAVLNGGKKAFADGDFIQNAVEQAYKEFKNSNFCVEKFCQFDEAIQTRIIIRMFNNSGCTNRVPYVFIQDVLKEIKNKKRFRKQFTNCEISSDSKELFIKNIDKTQTDLVIFDIIEESCEKSFPFGLLTVNKMEAGINFTLNEFSVCLKIDFPLCVRNAQLDDEIKCSDGNYKKVSDIYSNWHVNEDKRNLIPVIQELNTEKQELMCIFGEPFSFYNWVVSK